MKIDNLKSFDSYELIPIPAPRELFTWESR